MRIQTLLADYYIETTLRAENHATENILCFEKLHFKFKRYILRSLRFDLTSLIAYQICLQILKTKFSAQPVLRANI